MPTFKESGRKIWMLNDFKLGEYLFDVDIDGAKPHYHKRAIELYYVLEGEGTIRLDGQEHAIRKGSVVQIPPGVLHSGTGRMRVPVVAIPNVKDDIFYPEQTEAEEKN